MKPAAVAADAALAPAVVAAVAGVAAAYCCSADAAAAVAANVPAAAAPPAVATAATMPVLKVAVHGIMVPMTDRHAAVAATVFNKSHGNPAVQNSLRVDPWKFLLGNRM